MLEKDKIDIKNRKEQKEKHIKEWKRIKKEMIELNLNENHINRWTNKQLKNMLFLKRRINEKPVPRRKKELIKLLVEWKDKPEIDWCIDQEQVEE